MEPCAQSLGKISVVLETDQLFETKAVPYFQGLLRHDPIGPPSSVLLGFKSSGGNRHHVSPKILSHPLAMDVIVMEVMEATKGMWRSTSA